MWRGKLLASLFFASITTKAMSKRKNQNENDGPPKKASKLAHQVALAKQPVP
jgi:hypothetical protein